MHPAALDNIRKVAQNYNEAKTQLLYKKLVEIARQQCEDRLEKIGRKGIKGVVHGRVRKYASLTNKLTQIQKDEEKSPDFGASVSSIYEHPDMGDLAGVRIGLYFPDDIAKVEKEIKEHFDVKHTFGTVRGGRDVTTDRNEDIEKHGNGPWSSNGQDGAADH
ncbi:putative ankyrin repeat protein [Rosellinia necatrix]|uniref:Putative ankyrin repeat protein n=1 Tax=Rosellinia necatrix TaxID=77044 RepID=A0A1S8A768_ROSNE|nr:putative ankyrin repeat protein [Rosellinia necatrix]